MAEKAVNAVFIQKCKNLVETLIRISEKSSAEGLLALEELIDNDKFLKGNILDVGLRLCVDGRDSKEIEKILTNLINLETDDETRHLGNIIKEGIVAIQEGYNSALLKLLLNSYANIDIEEALKSYNDKLSDYINNSSFYDELYNFDKITDLITGTIKDLKTITDKDGKKIGIATLMNNNKAINILLFSNVLERHHIKDGMKIAVRGKKEYDLVNEQSYYKINDLKLLKVEKE